MWQRIRRWQHILRLLRTTGRIHTCSTFGTYTCSPGATVLSVFLPATLPAALSAAGTARFPTGCTPTSFSAGCPAISRSVCTSAISGNGAAAYCSKRALLPTLPDGRAAASGQTAQEKSLLRCSAYLNDNRIDFLVYHAHYTGLYKKLWYPYQVT